MAGICAEKAGIQGYSSVRFSNWEIWDYYNFCWFREIAILHKADFVVREIYYYDKFINRHTFNFNSWQRNDLYNTLEFAQQRVNVENHANEFIGYPMVYKCSKTTWKRIRARCMYKHIVNWKIPLDKIIDI